MKTRFQNRFGGMRPIFFKDGEGDDGGDPGNAGGGGGPAGGGGDPAGGDPGNLLTDPGGDPAGGEPGKYPENWRELYADGNTDTAERLSRYATPAAVANALIAAQNKLSSGEYRSTDPFPEKGTDEEKAAWRVNNGVPEGADKYDLGIDAGDDEMLQATLESFQTAAFAANLPSNVAKDTAAWIVAERAAQQEARSELDSQVMQESQDFLRTEWGTEYRGNVNRIHGLLDTAPEGVKEKILNGRLEDGTPIGSDAATLQFLLNLALEINPATTVVPGAGANINGAIADEITSIESLMGDKNSKYWKGPEADKLQARYRELITARDKLNRKSA